MVKGKPLKVSKVLLRVCFIENVYFMNRSVFGNLWPIHSVQKVSKRPFTFNEIYIEYDKYKEYN